MKVRQGLESDPEKSIPIQDQHRLVFRHSAGLPDGAACSQWLVLKTDLISPFRKSRPEKGIEIGAFIAQCKYEFFNSFPLEILGHIGNKRPAPHRSQAFWKLGHRRPEPRTQ